MASSYIFRFLSSLFSRKGRNHELTVYYLRVVKSKSDVIDIEISINETGLSLKKMAFEKISDSPKKEDITNYKLIRSKTKQTVGDVECLKDLNIHNNEEFLMIVTHRPVGFSYEENLGGPTEIQILEKTSHIEKVSIQRNPFNFRDLLFEDDMRKIFVTLAIESAHQLSVTPFADKLVAYYRLQIQYYIKHCKNVVEVMVQLGFPKRDVKRAMKLKASNPTAALDWLIANEVVSNGNHDTFKSPRSSSQRRASILSSTYEPTGNILSRVNGLLEIVKFYAEKDELVDQDNLETMVSMGFKVNEAHEALRITRNNVGAATQYLHGDKNPSITELRDGVSKTSQIRKKFLESAQIQQSLSEPHAFAFYITFLDDPLQLNAWKSFSGFGELMTHIIIKYHEEKYVLATNQFNGSHLPISALSAPN